MRSAHLWVLSCRRQPAFPYDSRGFTFVELVITVAIVGVLAATAIPRFVMYRMRAVQTESKTNMVAILRFEQTYASDHGGYTDDLCALAWAPEGVPRYLYGFTSNTSGTGCNDSALLRALGRGSFSTAGMIDAFGNPLVNGRLPTAEVISSRVVIGAVANLDNDATLDQWTLDSATGQFTNVTNDIEQ